MAKVKTNPIKMHFRLTILSVAALSSTAFAQPASQPNRFTAGAWLPFNISATFEGPKYFATGTDPGPVSATAVSREYDDGYVRVDSEGNSGGVTWYWGYRDASQVPGDDTLRMHSLGAVTQGATSIDADGPAVGFEVAYLRDISRSDKHAWGLRASFAYAGISISDSRSIRTQAQQITDVYSLYGITPPGDPSAAGWQYQGAKDIPGPLIDSSPGERQVQTLADTALTTGWRELETTLLVLKLGPWLELPIGDGLFFQAGGGVALTYADSTFSFSESTSLTGFGNIESTGRGSDGTAKIGAYAQAGFDLSISDQWSLYVLGGYEHLGKFRQDLAGRKVSLDLDGVWTVQTGVALRF